MSKDTRPSRRQALLGDRPGSYAIARQVRVSPTKARRVVDLVRGMGVDDALSTLQFAPQAASEPVRKVLESAIANARVKADKAAEAFDERALVISAAYVDEGPTLKRFQPRAQGRAFRIRKRTCHITIELVSIAGATKTGTTEGRRGTRSSQSAKGGNR